MTILVFLAVISFFLVEFAHFYQLHPLRDKNKMRYSLMCVNYTFIILRFKYISIEQQLTKPLNTLGLWNETSSFI